MALTVNSAEFTDSCKHPAFTEADYREYLVRYIKSWGGCADLFCEKCAEYLYPEDEGDEDLVIYAGEPKHAGDDPFGRPNDPSYWTE